LNRVGNAMSIDELGRFPNSSFGFTWNDGDESTQKWRPQGITTVRNNTTNFAVVSWYGRSQENYENRGVRLSFVDLGSLYYRHILLVDENYATFENMHAGGIAYVADCNCVHVPDSRSGTKKVYTFSLDNIRYVPDSDRSIFFDYAYVISRDSSYSVPITPSFMSWDSDRLQMVVGTFYQCSSYHQDTSECLSRSENTLSWYSPGAVGSDSPTCAPFFSEMQGVASGIRDETDRDKSVVWASSSYGSSHISHLHVTSLDVDQCMEGASFNSSYRVITYPPGLEDLHVARFSPQEGAEPSTFLWAATEFGTKDGTGNKRAVFTTDVQFIMP
jgi:hypothetical protein